MYTFHHYHSTAHEVLGFALLPTGTGHCELKASEDFPVIGVYPPDQHWDICRSAPSQEAMEHMRNLPFPNSDPVHGSGGR